MNVKRLFTDDSAVSPVIGVVLMVAITVLLAATAATFFLGIGQDNTNTKPQIATSFDYEADTSTTGGGTTYADDSITVSHNSGDTVEAKNLEIVVSGARIFDEDGGGYSELNERYQWDEFDGVNPDDEVSGGDAVTLQADSEPLPDQDGLDLDGATVEIVWDDPGSSSTFTLNSWQD